jgi:hypothetical protein
MDFVHPDEKTVAAILATLSKENPAVNFKDVFYVKTAAINGSTGMSILTSKRHFVFCSSRYY